MTPSGCGLVSRLFYCPLAVLLCLPGKSKNCYLFSAELAVVGILFLLLAHFVTFGIMPGAEVEVDEPGKKIRCCGSRMCSV
jgi:hypothetical protein